LFRERSNLWPALEGQDEDAAEKCGAKLAIREGFVACPPALRKDLIVSA
jgi:hypothetical protein